MEMNEKLQTLIHVSEILNISMAQNHLCDDLGTIWGQPVHFDFLKTSKGRNILTLQQAY